MYLGNKVLKKYIQQQNNAPPNHLPPHHHATHSPQKQNKQTKKQSHRQQASAEIPYQTSQLYIIETEIYTSPTKDTAT